MYNCKNIKIMKGELFGNMILVVVLSAEGQWVRLTVCINQIPKTRCFFIVSLCTIVPPRFALCCGSGKLSLCKRTRQHVCVLYFTIFYSIPIFKFSLLKSVVVLRVRDHSDVSCSATYQVTVTVLKKNGCGSDGSWTIAPDSPAKSYVTAGCALSQCCTVAGAGRLLIHLVGWDGMERDAAVAMAITSVLEAGAV